MEISTETPKEEPLRFAELEYWIKDGQWLCQYRPELWGDNYTSLTMPVTSSEAEMLDEIRRLRASR